MCNKPQLYILIFFVVVAVIACSPPQPTEQSLQLSLPNDVDVTRKTILPNGVLIMGTLYGKQTYYLGPEGPTGFEYELAKGFAEYLKSNLVVLPFFSFQELTYQLAQGNIDFIATGLQTPAASNDEARWGPVYQTVDHKLVYLQGKPRPREWADLRGRLSVIPETSHALAAKRGLAYKSAFTFEQAESVDAEELLAAIANGELDYTVTDTNTLSIARRRFPDLSIGFTVLESTPLAWQLSEYGDAALQAALLDYFSQIRTDGSLAALEERYFGHVQTFDFVDTKAFIDGANKTLPSYADAFKSLSLDIDWRLLAALSYQESHWNPNAVSPTGVKGLMMLTLETADDWGVDSRLDPIQSIAGGARYFSSLTKRIPARITSPDRIWMALAAYNIGLGHLEDARVLTQRQGGDPDLWVDVKVRLPLLQQKRFYRTTRYGYARGKEALQYVENIRRYYDTLVWMDSQSPPWH